MRENTRLRPLGAVKKRNWLALALLCAAGWLLFVHLDVLETSGHSYIFLDSLFSGGVLHFFEDVAARPFDLYYENHANYNIAVYLLYGVFQLPYFIITKVFGLAPYTPVLVYTGKLVALAFLFGCVWLVGRLGLAVGLSEEKAGLAALAFAISAPVYFSAAVMGQYDVVCLFFMLMALLQLLEGSMWRFVFWIGLGLAFKFFCVFALVPLVLLYQKKPGRIALYGLCSLWLLVPTTLLYAGRTGAQGNFLARMAQRLLEVRLPTGLGVSAFLLLFFLLCAGCWLWAPAQKPAAALWVCLASFSLLFLLVSWHPQWFMLVCPFALLTSFMQKNGTFWLAAELGSSLGYLGTILALYPTHMGSRLLDQGLLGYASGVGTRYPAGVPDVMDLLSAIPLVADIAAVLLCGTLVLGVVLKLPLQGGSLGQRLFGNALPGGDITAGRLWVVFGCSIGVWFVLMVASWIMRAVALLG